MLAQGREYFHASETLESLEYIYYAPLNDIHSFHTSKLLLRLNYYSRSNYDYMTLMTRSRTRTIT